MDPSFDVDAFLHEILPQISGETCYEEFTELRVINEYPRYSYEIQDTWQNQDTVSIEYEFGGTAIVENIVADGKQKTKKKNSKMGKEDTKKLSQNRKAAKKIKGQKKAEKLILEKQVLDLLREKQQDQETITAQSLEIQRLKDEVSTLKGTR